MKRLRGKADARAVDSEDMSLRLAIDLDGVVADFNAGWISRYNEEFGETIPHDAVTTWDGLHELTHFPNMSGFWRWAQGRGDGSIFRHLDTYDGAVDTLWRLMKSGHQIVITTSKPGWAIHDTFAWISEHRIPTREVHITDEKWRVPADVYLDDSPWQISEIHSMRPEADVVRFVRPWNEHVPGVHDVAGWDEYEDLVARLAGTRGSRR